MIEYGYMSRPIRPNKVSKYKPDIKFELQLPHSLLFIFSKIISRYISIYLIKEISKVFQDSTTS